MILRTRKKMDLIANAIVMSVILGELVCPAIGDSSPQNGNPGIPRDRFLLLDSRIIEITKNAVWRKCRN